MKAVATQFAVALALLMMLGSNRAMAQTPTPPNEPNDFSAYFVGLDYVTLPHSTTQGAVSPNGLGFAHFGFYFRGIPGAVTGDIFEDYTNKRQRFDVGTTDPTSPKQLVTIWKFYDKNVLYLYRYDTGLCAKSSIIPFVTTAPIHPLFMDLANSTFQGQTGFAENVWRGWDGGLPGNVWTYQLSAGNTVEFGTGTTSTETPLYIARYTPGRITRLQFEVFTSGQPDASVFNLPAACPR